MSRPHRSALLLLVALPLLVAGCATLEPKLVEPPPPVAETWPIAATAAATTGAGATAAGTTPAADVGWRDFFTDPKLQQLIALALGDNRELRLAALDVERAQTQLRAQRSNLFPAVDATASETRQRFSAASLGSRGAGTFTQYAASVGVSYELDLFGKLRSADHAALERLLAQEETRRAVQLGLLGELARAYVTLAADRELERLARETLDSQQESFRLRTHEHDLGAISGLTLDQARTTVEAARVDLERYAGAIAVDTNALTLLVGAPFAAELLPAGLDAGAAALAPLPAGLPSEVLLRRPDVMAAEHRLRAANADIGVARAAFFPTISLTASTGYASDSLASLFTAGNRLWNFVPRLTAPLFHGGRLRAELKLAEIERDAAVAQYELTIQTAFREVADALALAASLARQVEAQQALVATSAEVYEIAQKRRELGRDSYLTVLDAQRSYYAAQQSLIALRLAQQANRATLYQALGGGWSEHSVPAEAGRGDPPPRDARHLD